MGSSFNGPPNPNDQLFTDTKDGDISGPPNPPDGRADDFDSTALTDLTKEKADAAAGE